jgi:hypothetical protein
LPCVTGWRREERQGAGSGAGLVPEDAEVRVHGLGIMASFGGRRAAGRGQAGTPVIVVTGLAIMGGIGIWRRPPKQAAKDSDREESDDTGKRVAE